MVVEGSQPSTTSRKSAARKGLDSARKQHKLQARSRSPSPAPGQQVGLPVQTHDENPAGTKNDGKANDVKTLPTRSRSRPPADTASGGRAIEARILPVRSRSRSRPPPMTADEARTKNAVAFRVRDLKGDTESIAMKTHALYYRHLYSTLSKEQIKDAADQSQGLLRERHLSTVYVLDTTA